MKSLSEAQGIPFLVSIIPTRSYLMRKLDIQPIDYDVIKKLKEKGIYQKLKLDFEKPLSLVTEHLDKNGFVYTDPSRQLKNHLQDRALNPGDDHLSWEGHKLFADLLYPVVQEEIKKGRKRE